MEDLDAGLDLENERPTAQWDSPKDVARPWIWVSVAFAVFALIFAGLSTADFIEHLDRQVHSIHCSLVPGAAQQLGESGCRTVMMSPYSSLFRTSLWGGLPISLLAMAVFSYLVYRGTDFALRRERTKRLTSFLRLAWALPVLTSTIYAAISFTEIGTACTLCVGIYVTSVGGFTSALIAHSMHVKYVDDDDWGESNTGAQFGRWFAEGVFFVAVLVGVHLVFAPQAAKATEGCGRLVQKKDRNKIMIPLGGKGRKSIALLDPLCPACKGFDERLQASAVRDKLELHAVLFPLDQKCNWMVKASLHPGACAVSEAILCQPEKANDILDWAFTNQAALLAEAKDSEKKLRRTIKDKFPGVSGCLGSARVRNKLNKSMRWAVANALPVLTPQLFVGERRICDEDTDLGLEYTIASMLAQPEGGAK